MRNKVFASYEPLLKQLKASGRFTKFVQLDSRPAREMLNYVYYQLVSCIEEKKFPRIGILIDINEYSTSKFIVYTHHTPNSTLLKCFTITKEDFELVSKTLTELSKSYYFSIQRDAVGHDGHITIVYREASE